VTRTLAGTDREPPEEPEPETAAGGVEGLDRLRLLLAGAMGTVLLSYALLVPSAAAVIATAGGAVSADGAFAAAIPLWLAAHQIPLVLQGQPLSVLPLLPTVGVITVIACGAGWSARRLGGRPRHDAGAVVAAVAGAHAAVAVLGSALLPGAAEAAVAPWSAMVGGGLVAAAAAAVGVVRACGLPPELATRFPGWVRPTLRGAGVALAGLAFVGATLLVAALVLQADAVAAAYARLAPGFGAGFGVTLLAGAYLPNAVLAAVSWALGPGVAVGAATASPFVTSTAEPSGFPLLAALPSGMPPVWALGVFVLPAGVGVLAGLASRRAAPVQHRFAAALGTAGLTACGVGVLSVMAGGRLATGPFDPVRLPVELLVPAALLWVGVPVMLIAVLRPGESEPDASGADGREGAAERDSAPAEDEAGDAAEPGRREKVAADPGSATARDEGPDEGGTAAVEDDDRPRHRGTSRKARRRPGSPPDEAGLGGDDRDRGDDAAADRSGAAYGSAPAAEDGVVADGADDPVAGADRPAEAREAADGRKAAPEGGRRAAGVPDPGSSRERTAPRRPDGDGRVRAGDTAGSRRTSRSRWPLRRRSEPSAARAESGPAGPRTVGDLVALRAREDGEWPGGDRLSDDS
jgi:hypothetical protein